MLPSFVITGFLGSGKTTLLINSAKKHFKGKKVAVIVNEFGEVGVDGKVLQNTYSRVMELPEGCICCTLHAEFEKSLAEIREKYNPDLLMVETSGASEPFPIILSLQNLACTIEGIICVVDSANFYSYREDPTALHQIGGSNIVVLNKIDLAGGEVVEELEKEIKEIWENYRVRNAFTGESIFERVAVYRSEFGNIPAEVFSGVFAVERVSGFKDHSHEHHAESEVVYPEGGLEEVERFLDSLGEDVVRVKGIVKDEGGAYLVNYSFGYRDFAPLGDYLGRSFLVVIKRRG